jgi:broad specificity phosphatase PhoE
MPDARPLVIKLVRHGESQANVGVLRAREVGDYAIPLSPRGHDQAAATGRTLGADFVGSAVIYSSPYRRTRDTTEGILAGAGVARQSVRVFEDPRLREVEHGYEDPEAQEELREMHGWFYYRFRGGESPADCFDRTSSFLESMMRLVERRGSERVLIVTHGLTIRCFVMRFLHLTVEEFDGIENPPNGGIVTIAPHDTLEGCVFESGRWGVAGLTLRD